MLLCTSVDTNNIVKRTLCDDYGNCILCYRKGKHNMKCGRDFCRDNIFGQIMIFTNMESNYINLDLIETVLNKDQVVADMDDEEILNTEDNISSDVCLLLECNEYVSKKFSYTFKLLWYVHMYNKNEVNNLKYMVNEIVTIYNAIGEIYLTYK